MTVTNPSFEIVGDGPGKAKGWTLVTNAAAEEIAAFDTPEPEAVEDFEDQWDANELYAFDGAEVVFALASYGLPPRALEDFERSWSRNESFIRGLTDGVNALAALYDASQEPIEDFNEEWLGNHAYDFSFEAVTSTLAPYFSDGVYRSVENFEKSWRGNEAYFPSFGTAFSQIAAYEAVGHTHPLENFESAWPTRLLGAF